MPKSLIANLLVFLAYAQMVGWVACGWYLLSKSNRELWLLVASSVGLILLGWFILRALVIWADEIREGSS